MESKPYTSILKRVGIVLLAVGLIDTARLVYCLIHRTSYSSSLGLGVIAGIFLLRGSLRAASITRFLTVFILAGLLAALPVLFFFLPLDLLLTQLRLHPVASLTTTAMAALEGYLLFWVSRELGREPVQTAIASAGVKQRDARLAAAAGVGLAIVLGILLTVSGGGETSKRALAMAEQRTGPGYRFYISSLRTTRTTDCKSVFAQIVAWNKNEIREIPVQWQERF